MSESEQNPLVGKVWESFESKYSQTISPQPNRTDHDLYVHFLIHAPEMPKWFLTFIHKNKSEWITEDITYFEWRKYYAKRMVEISKDGMK